MPLCQISSSPVLAVKQQLQKHSVGFGQVSKMLYFLSLFRFPLASTALVADVPGVHVEYKTFRRHINMHTVQKTY